MCWDCYNNGVDPYTERNVYREEDEFEMPYKAKAKKPRKSKNKGCPARQNEKSRPHIYVWVEYRGWEYGYKRNDRDDLVYVVKNTTWWDYECIGCGHRNNRRWAWSSPPKEIYSIVKDAGEFSWK